MRFRSTGLGDAELKGRMKDLSPVGDDLLVLYIQTYEPVEWTMKAAMEREDILKAFKGILKPSVLFFIMRTLVYFKKNPKEPENIMDKSIQQEPVDLKQVGEGYVQTLRRAWRKAIHRYPLFPGQTKGE